MTKSKVSRSRKSRPSRSKRVKLPPLPRGEHAVDVLFDEELRAAHRQAYATLKSLEAWCTTQPGRRFTIERTTSGWSASLDEHQTASGSTMADAAAQIAVAAAFSTPSADEVVP